MQKDIPVDLLDLSPLRRHRKSVSVSAEELEVARDFGIQRPIVVRPNPNNSFRWEVLQGERDLTIALRIGLSKVPTTILPRITDLEARRLIDADDHKHKKGDPIEDALTIQEMMDREGLSLTAIADILGTSLTQASNRLRLLKASSHVRDLIRQGKLSEAKGRALIELPIRDQELIADRTVRHGLSTRQVESLARDRKHDLAGNRTKQSKSQSSEVAGALGSALPVIEKDPNIQSLENGLSQRFGVPVTIETDAGGGELRLRYANFEILDGLLDRLGRA